MALEEYRRKRDFKVTPEPSGSKTAASAASAKFVVHKHAASRLHYDLRLEIGGVYASWAIPKGPSLDPADKRLAVHVEDHPLEYGRFEGVIPAGEYGGGAVMIWDRGDFLPIGDPAGMLAAGSLKFVLEGSKLTGAWALVRMKPRGGRDEDNWLLIKERDGSARPRAEYDVTEGATDSVSTGRTMEEIATSGVTWTKGGVEGAPGDAPDPAAAPHATVKPAAAEGTRAVAGPMPFDAAFQLATLVDDAPDGDAWLHEVKYDGYRLRIALADGRARVRTRGGEDWTDRFASLVTAAQSLPAASALLDGEAIVFDSEGRSDFGLLQDALARGQAERVSFAAFDLLYLDGFDLRGETLVRRKELLRSLLDAGGAKAEALHYVDHVRGRGPAFRSASCDLELEGSVSKRADRPWVAGRTRDWVKAKCVARQEFVIVGWTDPAGSREGFGSLLLGVHDRDGALVSAGRVGTGFGGDALHALRARLDALATGKPPLADAPSMRGAHWVRPELVAEVAFREWTREGVLRQASFVGLREDADPAKVVRESPVPEAAFANAADDDPPAGSASLVAGTTITNPSKVLGVAGVTKHALARYYEAVAPVMVPHLRGRLLTVVRCPHGTADAACFFQKHPEDVGWPSALPTVPVVDKDGPAVYFHADDLDGILALVQLGVLEIHCWNSLASDYDRPDRVIFDLDPGPGTGFSDVAEAAVIVRDALEALGLAAFVKTTGGHGLHVVSPIDVQHGYDSVREFTHAFVERLAQNDPARFTSKMAKTARPGRVFIDYLRNAHGATAVCAYSTRARQGAPVSTPVTWDELSAGLDPAAFDVRTVPERLAASSTSPWPGYEQASRPLSTEIFAALGLAAPDATGGTAKRTRRSGK
jgi:bifunctional non-homologous end joining protein LigD